MDQSKLTAPVGSIETSSMDVNMEKRRIKKNVLLIGIAFFFNFLSFEVSEIIHLSFQNTKRT